MKKVLSIYVWCVVALVAATCVACINEDTSDEQDLERMPIVLRIPASNVTRTPGDPGSAEGIPLPRYAYIFVVIINSDASETIIPINETLDVALWQRSTLTSSLPQSTGDDIWEYTGDLSLKLPPTRSEGRVYAAVSCEPITFSPPTTETAVQNLLVDFTDNGTPYSDYSALRDVYSTPLDYQYDVLGTGTPAYYGTIKDISTRVPHVELLLYHVASRVDLIWNVSPEARSSVQISDMQLKGLKVQGCKIFRPTQNVGVGSSPTTLSGPAFNEGNQWNGRHYFYAIPFVKSNDPSENYFPFTIEIKKNGEGSASYSQEIHINASPSDDQGDLIDNKLLGTGTVFVPWLRGELVIEN